MLEEYQSYLYKIDNLIFTESENVNKLCVQITDYFSNLSLSLETDSNSINKIVLLILECTNKFYNPSSNSNQLINEAWKSYLKILKIGNHQLNVETCNLVATSLLRLFNSSLVSLLETFNDNTLNLVFFHAQRVSATLAYCISGIEETKTLDLYSLLLSAYGAIIFNREIISKEVYENLEEKMLSVILKALYHPITKESFKHKSLFQTAQTKSTSSITLSSLPNVILYKNIGTIFIWTNEIKTNGLYDKLLSKISKMIVNHVLFQSKPLKNSLISIIISNLSQKIAGEIKSSSQSDKKEILV
jgi:hypothetical protein